MQSTVEGEEENGDCHSVFEELPSKLELKASERGYKWL